MRITAIAFFILVNEALAGGGGGKHHVHFKINVPEIIKHHIHTKTVFIHVHTHDHGGGGKKKTVPKKKETHHGSSHYEDWGSWSSSDFHDGHGEGHDHKSHRGSKDTKGSGKGHGAHYTHEPYGQGFELDNHPHKNPHSQMLTYDPEHFMKMQMQDFLHSQSLAHNPHAEHLHGLQNHHEQPSQQQQQHGGGVIGYSYPPQYGGQHHLEGIRDVKEHSHNEIEPYNESFEEGYRKGHHSETGHLLSNDMNKFYDDKFEEGDYSNNGSEDESHEGYKTHEDTEENDSSETDHAGYNNYHDGDHYAVVHTR